MEDVNSKVIPPGVKNDRGQTLGESEESLQHLQKRLLIASALVIGSLVLIAAVSSYFFREEILAMNHWILDNLGFYSLAGLVYFSDTLISPVPPDAALFIISNSSLKADWPYYVGFIAATSTLAGFSGYFLGRFVAKNNWVPQTIVDFANKNRPQVKKYGVWAVILGALTPFPFSLTCWSAGVLEMRFGLFALGALSRFPRVFFYYWLIESASFI